MPDEWADVVISNGVMNLFPEKVAGLRQTARVLRGARVFSGAPQVGSAANFGAVGINFRARKARDEPEWELT